MNIDELAPDERVFHVDRECYIFYLGSDKEDVRPLVRLGNSDHLDPRVIYNTSSIIVPDSVTGDPSLEPVNVILKDIKNSRYVGDKKTVQDFFTFIQHIDIKNGKSSTLEEIKESHNRAEAVFFKDSNIRLLYDNDLVFDLARSRSSDTHFENLAGWLKERLSVNPLRYRSSDWSSCGLFLIDGSFHLFENGRIISLGLPPHYFMRFTDAGVDPDLVRCVVTDRVNSPLVQLLKRCRSTNQRMNVLGTGTEVVKSAIKLLQNGPGSLHAGAADFLHGKKKKIGSFTVERQDKQYMVTHSKLPGPVALVQGGGSARSRDKLAVNSRGELILGSGKQTLQLPDRIPLLFAKGTPERIIDHQVLDLLPLFKEAVMDEDAPVLTHINRFFEEAEKGSVTDFSLNNVKKQLRKASPSADHPFIYLYHNIAQVCRILSKSERFDERARRALRELSEQAGRLSERKPSIHLPLVAELYPEEEDSPAVLLYRSPKGPVYREDYRLAMDIRSEVGARLEADRQTYAEERKRLLALLDSLGMGEPQREMRAALKQQKKLTAAGIGRAEPLEPAAAMSAGTRSDKKKKREEERKRAQKRRMVIPIGAIVVIALLAALAFLPIKEAADGTRVGLFGPIGRKAPSSVLARDSAAGPDGSDSENGGDSGTENGGTEADSGSQTESGSGTGTEDLTGQKTYVTESGMELPVFREQIKVTVFDVYRLSNWIALNNGYHSLDNDEVGQRDPDWIYPGNRLTLPDGSTHEVKKGDAIWYVAGWYIHDSLEELWPEYKLVKEQMESQEHTPAKREQWLTKLENLRKQSFSQYFNKMLNEKIEILKKETG